MYPYAARRTSVSFPPARSASNISRNTSTLVPWQRSWRGENRSRHDGHPISNEARVVIVPVRELLNRYQVEGFPLRQFLGQPCPDLGAVVVLGPRRPIATHPLLPRPPCLGRGQHPLLVGHREELLTHAPGLCLRLDLVAVDHPPAIRIRACPVSARHRARRLLLRRSDNLERTDPALRPRPRAEMRVEPSPRSHPTPAASSATAAPARRNTGS